MIFFLVPLVSFSQSENNTDFQKLNERVERLEGLKENLEKQSELLEKEADLKAENLNSAFKENKLEIDQKLWMINIFLGVLGLGLLGSFIYFKNYVRRQAEELANKKVEESIDNIIEEKKDEFISLIQSQILENKVKESSKILVLSETEVDAENLQTFFSSMEIRNVDVELSSEYKDYTKKYDLIILDDQNMNGHRHDLFREYVEKLSSEEVFFVFFGDRFKINNREYVNFANSRITLYNQIISSLKYKEIMKDH